MFGSNTNSAPSFGGFGSNTGNTSSGGTLFGNKPAAPSGGLFGNTNTTSTTSGSLFGNQNKGTSTTTGGGLFGSSNNTNPNSSGGFTGNSSSSSGVLFNNASNNAGTGLFGAANSNATNNSGSGGLFGGANKPVTNTTSGGLFGGSNNNTSGGLFGSTNNNNTNNNASGTTGGLFGNKPATTTVNGGLFGNNNNNTTSSGLFGSNNNTNSSGGLFGAGSNKSATGLYSSSQQAQPIQQLTSMTRVGDLPPEMKKELEEFDKYINSQHLIATTLQADLEKHDHLIQSIPKDINYLHNKLLSTKQALKFDTNQLQNLKSLNNELTEDINKILQLILQLSTPGTKLSSGLQLNEFFVRKIKKYHEILNYYEGLVDEANTILNGLERNCNEGFGNFFNIIEVIKSQYSLFMELCESMAQIHNEVNRLNK